MARSVSRLNSMIETKSGVWNTGSVMRDLPHNNIYIVISPGNGMAGERLNMLQTGQGVGDLMGNSQVNNRIGDKITVKGVLIKAMFENALSRPKVFYRLMIVKCSRDDVPTRATLFQNNATNKMLDQVNTERYTILREKKFTITTSTATANMANTVSGAPEESGYTDIKNAGMGTKLVNMWLPGSLFGRGGNVTYENTGVRLKFFDYYIIVLAYDWYGTPQDENVVGKINQLYTKVYFQDA